MDGELLPVVVTRGQARRDGAAETTAGSTRTTMTTTTGDTTASVATARGQSPNTTDDVTMKAVSG